MHSPPMTYSISNKSYSEPGRKSIGYQSRDSSCRTHLPLLHPFPADESIQIVDQEHDEVNDNGQIADVISEDGRYLLNIQDLYKFAIDSSCIIKQYRRIIPQSDHRQFAQLRKLLDQISTFRTVFDHNISNKDGQLSVDEMARYMAWVRTTIGKSAPEAEDDYKTLNQKLSDMATELLHLLERFIHYRSVVPFPNLRAVIFITCYGATYNYGIIVCMN